MTPCLRVRGREGHMQIKQAQQTQAFWQQAQGRPAPALGTAGGGQPRISNARLARLAQLPCHCVQEGVCQRSLANDPGGFFRSLGYCPFGHAPGQALQAGQGPGGMEQPSGGVAAPSPRPPTGPPRGPRPPFRTGTAG